jgi:hypothetical protein
MASLAETLRNFVPMDTRMYATTLFGNRNPITEKDLSAQELAGIQDVIEQSKVRGSKGDVQYKDYAKYMGDNARPEYGPQIATKTTLGRFNYTKNPDGSVSVKDRYDFVNEARQKDVEKYQQMNPVTKALTVVGKTLADNPMKWPTNLASELGNAYIGNEGRDVNITIPRREILRQQLEKMGK